MNRPPEPDRDADKPKSIPPRESTGEFSLPDLDDPTQAGIGGAGVGLGEIEKGVATGLTNPETPPADPGPAGSDAPP